jgi:hypothetical protein
MDILDVMKLAHERTATLLRQVNTTAEEGGEVAITVCDVLREPLDPPPMERPGTSVRARSGQWQTATTRGGRAA